MANKKIKLSVGFILISSLVIFFFSVASADDVKFIYPVTKTVIYVSEIRVIGKADNNQPLALYVENIAGKREFQVTPADNYFDFETKLEPGKNTISIPAGSGTADSIEVIYSDKESSASYPDDYLPYYLHTKNNLTGTCENCHPKNDDNVVQYKYVVQKLTCITNECHPKFDEGKFQHKPFQKGNCVGCHNPHGSDNKDFLKYFGSDLCFTCHADAEKMAVEAKHVHFPVSRGECTSCHDPHKSNLEYHLKRETIAGLCEGCHGTLATNHKVLHTPVEAGDCIVCHVPHVSENERLLSDAGNALCFKCHKVRKEEFQSINVHEPVKKDCTICHDPHGSASINHLRTKKDELGNYMPVEQPVKELCLNCHRKLDPEIVDQIENGTNRHEPVDAGKCTLCHTPHSTDHPKQLRKPLSEICYSCHKDKKKQITSSKFRHGPINTDDCAQCHLPHGSKNRKILRSEFTGEFSIEFNINNYELCFNCHDQEIVLKKEVNNTTGFRNGKTNLHYMHVNTKGRNCKTCHNIHASNQEFHIRKKIPFTKRFVITLKYKNTSDGGGCIEGCHKPRKYDRIKPIINK